MFILCEYCVYSFFEVSCDIYVCVCVSLDLLPRCAEPQTSNSGDLNCFKEFIVLCFAVRRKETVQTGAYPALSENVTLQLTLCMNYRFRNPNQNVVWFYCYSLIKKSYCKVGWDAELCLFRLAPGVSDARINATLINFAKHKGRYVTYISEVTRICMCVSHKHTHTHTHILIVSREH
jgi:hypothetical protein